MWSPLAAWTTSRCCDFSRPQLSNHRVNRCCYSMFKVVELVGQHYLLCRRKLRDLWCQTQRPGSRILSPFGRTIVNRILIRKTSNIQPTRAQCSSILLEYKMVEEKGNVVTFEIILYCDSVYFCSVLTWMVLVTCKRFEENDEIKIFV